MVQLPQGIDVYKQIVDVKSKIESGTLKCSRDLFQNLHALTIFGPKNVLKNVKILKKYDIESYKEYIDLLKKEKLSILKNDAA